MLGNSCPNTFQPKSGEETFADVPFSPDIHRSRPLEALSCDQFDFFVGEIIQGVFSSNSQVLKLKVNWKAVVCLLVCIGCVRLMFTAFFFFLPLSRDENQRGHKEKEP